jgi:serine/threonine protein kinase
VDVLGTYFHSSHTDISHLYVAALFLGTGSFGTVYRAQGNIDGVLYAIKKSRRRPHNESERATMMHEVQALASLSAYEEPEKTSSIVRYYSAWMEDEYLCIQMELCESCACDITNFDNDCAYTLLRDILHALDVLHK